MNVLIFVVTMIMLLSVMTYARLESYRNSQAFQVIFKQYMQEDERGYINQQAKVAYDKIKVGTKKGAKSSKKINASPRLAIGSLFNSDRASKEQEWTQTKVLLKNLIKNLYSVQPFYKKMEQEDPSFVDHLITAITQAIDDLPKEKRPKKPSDLATLTLEDPKLDRMLYEILRGASYMVVVTDEQKMLAEQKNSNALKPNESEAETSEDEEDASEEEQEFKSPPGYFSLLDFVTGYSKPVRIYLAPKEVLQSIFPGNEIVQSIMEERERLYKQAMNDGDTQQLSETFKEQFLKMKDPSIDDKALDFSINKTNPKRYR